MAHNRKFVPSGVGLVVTRFRNAQKVRDQDKIEQLLIDSHFLDNAPFKWVGMVYRYGTKHELFPDYYGIDQQDGELEFAIELDTHILEWADSSNLDLLYDIFMIGALDALIDVGLKYNLPTELLRQERAKYGAMPYTIEECEAYKAVGPDDTSKRIQVNRCPKCNNIKRTLKARQCLKCGYEHEPYITY